MKLKIIKVSGDKHNISAELEIYKDDGTLLFRGSRGFVSTSTDKTEVLNYLKDSIKNIAQQAITEGNAILKTEAERLIDKEIII